MRKNILLLLLLTLFANSTLATTCPDPDNTSLRWGVPPPPWIVSPLSPNPPQWEENTAFVRANILVAGYGRGVLCTYKNSVGIYQILWEGLVKIPSRNDYRWIDAPGGYICTQSLEKCEFYTA